MPDKVFLYSDDVADKDTRQYFLKKDYTLVPLSKDEKAFWSGVGEVAANGFLVLLSHGNENGPLMVEGNTGSDMTDEDITNLGSTLATSNVTFYCLSCHTGKDPFLEKLLKTRCNFVAPVGYAELKSSSAGANFYSVEGGTYVGWQGQADLVPSRASKPLNIP